MIGWKTKSYHCPSGAAISRFPAFLTIPIFRVKFFLICGWINGPPIRKNSLHFTTINYFLLKLKNISRRLLTRRCHMLWSATLSSSFFLAFTWRLGKVYQSVPPASGCFTMVSNTKRHCILMAMSVLTSCITAKKCSYQQWRNIDTVLWNMKLEKCRKLS